MSSGSESQREREPGDSREQFARVAEAYRTSSTHSDPVALARFISICDLKPNHRVLDVATGAGHVAMAAAPLVREVVALDLTEEMLEQARSLAASREARNVSFVLANAEELPFPSESFDRVVVRSAPHHFHHLLPAVAEAYRVLVPGGAFAVSDCSPPPVVRDWLEAVEVGRDQSHVRSRALEEWRGLLLAMGFTVEHAERIEQEKDILDWFEVAGVSAPERKRLLDYYETAPAAIHGQLTPQWREGRFYHRYWHALIRARRPLEPVY
ncbi:MAG: class I SAM-dependent methyltransferase [Candidatus Dormibacteria bacterium]